MDEEGRWMGEGAEEIAGLVVWIRKKEGGGLKSLLSS